MENKKFRGTVILDKTTYGFIECPEFPKNIFYHISQCLAEEQIHIGDTVEFVVSDCVKYGGIQASHVRLVTEEVKNEN